ncbi:MAG: DUF378 domain-containing protein [Gammaproteobacteria bacterium]|nr:MAG: DUF378 domain-containing protein [Gammaproteobacteria bacterium]
MATTSSYDVERRHLLDRRESITLRTLTVVDWIALALVIVGGVNWGLIGLFNVDLVAALFGVMTPLSRAVYVLVGLSALYTIITATKMSSKR